MSSSRSDASDEDGNESETKRPGILSSAHRSNASITTTPHSPPVVYMHGISTPIQSPEGMDSPMKKKFKYLSPRIGSYFQAQIEPFTKKENEDNLTVGDSSQGSSAALVVPGSTTSATASFTTVPGKKRKVGRPKQGVTTAYTSNAITTVTAAPLGNLKKQEWNLPDTYEPTPKVEQSKRGAVCVHRPTSTTTFVPNYQHEEFLTFGRNLMLQTPRHLYYNIARADKCWREALEENKYPPVQPVVVKNKPGRKRKLVEKEEIEDQGEKKNVLCTTIGELTSSATAVSASATSNINASPAQEELSKNMEGTSIGLEDDECMLEYYNYHNRNMPGRAEFLTMVALCRGKAMSMRRKIKKLSKEDAINMPLAAVIGPLSDSWRRRYERGVFSKVIGDLRQVSTLNKYPFFEIRDSDVLDGSTSSKVFPWMKGRSISYTSTSISTIDETNRIASIISKYQSYDDLEYVDRNKELLEQWKSIFESGQNILEHSKGGLKPFLRDLLQILSKAYTIPSPEEVFGRRDSTAKNISMCLNSIMDLVEEGRDTLAYFTDGAYDVKAIGIDVQSLSKHIEKRYVKCPVQLEEADIIRAIVNEALEWESRLESSSDDDDASSSASEDLHLPQQSLFSAEALASEGNSLSIRPKSLVILEERIQRAYDLRQRIREWNQSNNDNESVKYLASMIKDANKINLGFPELSLLSKVHKNAEEWIERANIALRSKISLSELEDLVHLGDKLPLGVTTTLDKLRLRLNSAVEWIADLKEVVPCPLESISECGTELDARHKSEWFLSIWNILRKDTDDDITRLKEMSTAGARLPVEVAFVHLLQTAIDARNWSLKARRWVPSSSDFRRGKIDDLMEHLEFSKTIINKFSSLTDGVVEWKLDYAEELQEIVDKAEIWFEKYEPYLSGDARKSQRPVISCDTILDIIKGAEEIPSNLGNPTLKINRIHNEVKNWVESHSDFLRRCNISCTLLTKPDSGWTNKPVSFHEVTAAIESASKEMSVDLVEVQKLTEMVELSQEWFEKVNVVAPIHGRRSVGYGRDGQKSKPSISEVSKLLKAANSVPMDTTKETERLHSLLDESLEWARGVYRQLLDITQLFNILSKERDESYGEPSDILSWNDHQDKMQDSSHLEPFTSETNDLSHKKKQDNKGTHLYQLMTELANSAEKSPFLTFEEEVVQHLSKAVQWCKSSSEIIDSYYDSFGSTKWKDELKKLISESKYLDVFGHKFSFSFPDKHSENYITLQNLNESSMKYTEREKGRLLVLQRKQDEYDIWCKTVQEKYEESEKRVPLSLLQSLSEEGSTFPDCSDVVRKMARDFKIATEWIETAKIMLESSNKLFFEDVKSALNKVHRVKFTCEEYETLRRALNDARAWSNHCKKNGLDSGSAPIHVLKSLMSDYERLRIAMPEEINSLREALCGYCICRRPYEGFMIGCDTCDEWYHGSCIGISEAQGEKIEKFICLRCHVKKLYEMYCLRIAGVIKKWCDPKELSKSRSQDNQKHQRKVREKKKEIEKWKEELQNNLRELQELKSLKNTIVSSPNKSLDVESSGDSANYTVVGQNGATVLEQEPKSPLIWSIELYEKKINMIKVDISKATKALEQCNFRMEKLNQLSNTRKEIQAQEDRLAPAFRYWCTLVRQTILVPDTEEMAHNSLPNPSAASKAIDDLISKPMEEVIAKLTDFSLKDFPDAIVIQDSLYCIGWCCLALNVLKKKPTLEQLQTVVHLSDLLRISEGKCLTMIKSMIANTLLWTAKVKHDLKSTPGNMEPYDAEMLKKLSLGMLSVPLTSPEEKILCNVLKDEGAKHCLCCSPRDSSMTNCLSCGKWYHSKCLPSPILDSKTWVCNQCHQSPKLVSKQKTNDPKNCFGSELVDWSTEAASQPSAHAPTPEKLWPPFGLSGSTESMNVLGVALTYNLNNMEIPTFVPPTISNESNSSITKTLSNRYDASSMKQGITVHQSDPKRLLQFHEKPPQATFTDHSMGSSSHLANNYGTPPATTHSNQFSISGIDERIVQNAVQVALEIAISGMPGVTSLNGIQDNINAQVTETAESKQELSQQQGTAIVMNDSAGKLHENVNENPSES